MTRVRASCRRREFALRGRGYTATRHQREVGTGYFDLVATALNPAQRHPRAGAARPEAEQF